MPHSVRGRVCVMPFFERRKNQKARWKKGVMVLVALKNSSIKGICPEDVGKEDSPG